ncbi:unnamed protein product [Parnassius apollo]|uniref:(apollo) hypothetical protein n=1 Tax=Parnassius apollo TaxID=110799 RepID=A0A8S3W3I8_PARAO|nr:unnamed protein product [Parnassius apollo]
MRYIVCQACLRIGDDVFPMSTKDIEWYQQLVNEVAKGTEMFMCIFCTSLLRKLSRFIEQCREAYVLLNEMGSQGLKLLPSHLNINHNIRPSPTITYHLGPAHVEDLDLDLKVEDDPVFDSNDAYITEDEDDVPLILFCGDSAECAIGSLDNVNVKEESLEDVPVIKEEEILKTESNIKLEEIKESDGKSEKSKPKKRKNAIKEGFTSRMVQETPEYIVIKLTKEQVLEEMRERLKSEKYLRAPFKCEKCVKGFNFEDVLESHMETHSPKKGPLQCELCSQHCPSQVSLRGHMKSHTTRYKCKICGYIRLSRQHVLEHYSIVHSNTSAAYSCKQCVFTTNKRTVMQRHVRLHNRTEPHACHKCGKLYKSLESLRVHTMRHDNKKRFECDQCNLSFVYATLLQKHVQSVHVRRDYYCVECDIKFKSMDTLKLHFKRAKKHRESSSVK